MYIQNIFRFLYILGSAIFFNDPHRPGGVAQWTSNPRQERKALVRIPRGFKENIAMLLSTIDLICIVGLCV
jgi:hypothetical protein